MDVTIKFVGREVDDSLVVRDAMSIPAMMKREGAYVDSPAYVTGYKNEENAGGGTMGAIYCKSIYATNYYDDEMLGALAGLTPMANTTTKFAWFQRAIDSAAANGDEDEGVTFSITTADEQIYWLQMADAMADLFAVTVGTYTNRRVEGDGTDGTDDGDDDQG